MRAGRAGRAGCGAGRFPPRREGGAPRRAAAGAASPAGRWALSAFSLAAMTMQFISHRFPEDHDPTIGEIGPPRPALPPRGRAAAGAML